jgi:thiosulfate/3-mercaptopyruvate sulfurtransferase
MEHPAVSPVVSPQRLVELQQSAEAIALIDCRFSLADPLLGQQQYKEGHIPGAYYLDLNQDLSSPVQPHGGRHPLPDSSVLAGKLSRMGITDETLVIAYDDSRFAFASRLWWLLKYMGHERAAVLDGGLAAYKALGLPTASNIPAEQAGAFIPQIKPDWVIDIHGVRQRQQQPYVKLIDSREADRYRGEREPIDPVAGHIPGALNYPWQQVTDDSGKFRSPSELKHYWADVSDAAEIVVYCGSGVTACVNLLALAASNFSTGRLYAGSWSDWCSYPLDAEGQAVLI